MHERKEVDFKCYRNSARYCDLHAVGYEGDECSNDKRIVNIFVVGSIMADTVEKLAEELQKLGNAGIRGSKSGKRFRNEPLNAKRKPTKKTIHENALSKKGVPLWRRRRDGRVYRRKSLIRM